MNTKLKIALIITAAGKGLRFGCPEGKLFAKLNNIPILIHTCRKFTDIPDLDQIIITASPGQTNQFKQVLDQYAVPFDYELVPGGDTRQSSIKKAVECLNRADVVMVHDGARPNISKDLICRLIRQAEYFSAVVPGIPVTDTIKSVDEGFVVSTITRDMIYRVQTPQVFNCALLKKAYELPLDESITDDAMLMERLGHPVKMIEGEINNIKITVPEDLVYLRYLLQE